MRGNLFVVAINYGIFEWWVKEHTHSKNPKDSNIIYVDEFHRMRGREGVVIVIESYAYTPKQLDMIERLKQHFIVVYFPY